MRILTSQWYKLLVQSKWKLTEHIYFAEDTFWIVEQKKNYSMNQSILMLQIYVKHEMCRGYLAPEYATLGQLSDKVDVYSFGVLALEVVSGRKNINFDVPVSETYLTEWVCISSKQRCLHCKNFINVYLKTIHLYDH